MALNQKPLWLIIGGRMRLGRWIGEDLARDHELILTSSKSWKDESWHRSLSAIRQTLTWDAQDRDISSKIKHDLDSTLGSDLKINGVCFLSSTFDEQTLGTWNTGDLEKTFTTNLIFPMLCSQFVLPFLHPAASLHYFLDHAIENPFKKRLPYSAAKAGLTNFIQGFRALVGDQQSIHGHVLGTIIKEGEPKPQHLHTPPHPFSSLMKEIRGK